MITYIMQLYPDKREIQETGALKQRTVGHCHEVTTPLGVEGNKGGGTTRWRSAYNGLGVKGTKELQI